MLRTISVLFFASGLIGAVHGDASFERCRKQYLAIQKIERQLRSPRSGPEASRLRAKKRDIQAWMRDNCHYDTRDYLLE